jgi:hypothetical protein
LKAFKVPCEIRGVKGTFQVYVGRPALGFHPLKYQAAWLWEDRQGIVDAEIMEAFDETTQTWKRIDTQGK